MKRFFCTVLCVCLLFGSLGAFAAAAEQAKTAPVIIVPGYGSSSLYLNYGTDEQEQVWAPNPEKIVGELSDGIGEGVMNLLAAFNGKTYEFGRFVGTGSLDVMEYIVCNPDGTSKYRLSHYPNDPAVSNYDYLVNENDGKDIAETHFAKLLAGKIGGKNVFIFHSDFRKSAIETVEELKAFVKEVKEFTSSKKVSMFGLSHGGLLVGTYLSLYGTRGDIDNAVMSVPALGGTTFAYQMFNADFSLAMKELVTFGETAININTNFASGVKEGKLTQAFNEIMAGFTTSAHSLFNYWGSIWDFMPVQYYDEMKAEFLDKKDSARLIALCDRVHYDIMKNYKTNFKKCQDAGVDVSILCSTGTKIAFGSETNSDIIIDVASASGAKCAEFGKRFPDGYCQSGKVCKNNRHRHVSPSLEIDASYAYLPENTWFVDGQFHGMYYFDEYTRSLATTLLLTDDIKDIYSDTKYPQFEISQHANTNVYAKFNNSKSGFLTKKDTAFVIKNITGIYPMKITKITCGGMELFAENAGEKIIGVGKEISVPITGKVPSAKRSYKSVTVEYFLIGSPTPHGSRTFDFTVL